MSTSPLQHPVLPHGDQQVIEAVDQPLARICCYCTQHHVMSEGTYPASHGMCDVALAREMAHLDAREAGGIGVDPVSQVGLGIAAALECLTGIGGLLGAKRQGELG